MGSTKMIRNSVKREVFHVILAIQYSVLLENNFLFV